MQCWANILRQHLIVIAIRVASRAENLKMFVCLDFTSLLNI